MTMAKKMKLPVGKFNNDCAPPVSCKQSAEDKARQRRYQAEDALRAIQRAEEVKNNKQLMSDVKALAKEQVDNLKKFTK